MSTKIHNEIFGALVLACAASVSIGFIWLAIDNMNWTWARETAASIPVYGWLIIGGIFGFFPVIIAGKILEPH